MNVSIYGNLPKKLIFTLGYNPQIYYERNEMLKTIIEQLGNGFFCPEEPTIFHSLIDSLLIHGDRFKVLADFESYIECQKKVSLTYSDQRKWVCLILFYFFVHFLIAQNGSEQHFDIRKV